MQKKIIFYFMVIEKKKYTNFYVCTLIKASKTLNYIKFALKKSME